jgi:hypothetical protein
MWSGVKDATVLSSRHRAHEVNGPSFAHAILTAKELLVLLPSSFSCVIRSASVRIDVAEIEYGEKH